MPTYRPPGVYVEEAATRSHAIEGVDTGIAGFVGIAPDHRVHINEAIPLTSWRQFVEIFVDEDARSTPLANAVHGFFLNGGARCHVVNIGQNDAFSGLTRGLEKLRSIDEIAIVAAPGFTGASAHDALMLHAEQSGNRIAILDSPAMVEDINDLTVAAEADGSPGQPHADDRQRAFRARESVRGFGASYFPHILVQDALDASRTVAVPPSGHVAGVYARTDRMRGVHKAPANEEITGALGVTRAVTQAEQDVLNPAHVNAIRVIANRGILVFGARTTAYGDPEWKYVNVRRFVTFVEQSVLRGTGWVVFEPNDEAMWAQLRASISDFMMSLWRQGMLAGAKPEQAFFIRCGTDTMTEADISSGTVNIWIGLAMLKPAEFTIIRLRHQAGSPAGTR